MRVSGVGLVLARAVLAERKRCGLTQRELADRLGLSPQTVIAIEAGDRAIPVDHVPAICRALGVTLNELARDASREDRRALGLDPNPRA